MNRLRLRLLIGLVVAVALAWGATLDLNAAAKAAAKATAKLAAKATATAAVAKAAPAPAPAPQKGKANNQQSTACTVNGKTFKNCPPALLKQAARQAARQNAVPQKTGVTVQLAGISPATAAISPLAAVGSGPTTAALTNFGPPDYFGAPNWANTALPVVSGTAVTGGIPKFVNTLAGLKIPALNIDETNNLGTYIPVAQADTTTFPGSDFYRIGLKEYTHAFHTNLPTAHVRGYVDLGNGTDSANHYLGPLIVAMRNRPTRILFTNQIATDLNIPVDTTYMGAGKVSDTTHSNVAASQKRATLHLHGGNTPWISDGTTHQWITPSGGDGQPAAAGFAKGFSAMNVPDMGSVLPNPSFIDGMQTFYWTNQQSGRLMFYHDHAYGITRLNVYAGEAAGFLLVDPKQEDALRLVKGVPGTIPGIKDPISGNYTGLDLLNADFAHLYPLVIQDKTFVPDAGGPGSVMAAQDPTWDFANWGGAGDLWYPHVYSPNQNPADRSGANGFGRYDWGPWFWPPQNASTLVLPDYLCSSAAYPGGAGLAFPPLMCPGVPDPSRPGDSASPSSTPEAFMDTPVVNGTAYPSLTVDPTAYRFQTLNAANDRALNLGLYVAEPVTLSVVITNPGNNYTNPTFTFNCAGATATGTVGSGTFNNVAFTNGVTSVDMATQPLTCASPTVIIGDTGAGTGATATVVMSMNTEVKMVPAVPVAARPASLPNCTSQLTMWGGGQITTTVPLTTPTGMQANCWPMYNSLDGYTAGPLGEKGVLSWGNSDGRTGGVPDPTTAGPPIVQIGAEGGVLPQLAVIPSTAVSYDYNKRSITVLNVLNHGLWLGPAERADIIVDFSQFAGKTLILYNDSPAPVPAGDPRVDYYTNDPDNSSTGGAPSTLAGYGPNTRTIMQIKVNPGCTGTCPPALDLAGLNTALPNIFAATQDPVILPETAYPALNGGAAQDTYIPIQATQVSAWSGAGIGPIVVTAGGSGYTSAPSILLQGGGGTGANATAVLATAGVATVSLSNTGGFGYSTVPGVSVTGGGGSGAAATAILGNQGVRRVNVSASGSGYTAIPTVAIAAPGCTPLGTATCAQATATASISNRRVSGFTVTNPGAGYTAVPLVSITGGGGTGGAGTALLGSRVTGFTVTAGSGYSSAPLVTVAAPTSGNCVPTAICTAATATAALAPRAVASVTVTAPGTGYTSAPTAGFIGGGGTGAAAIVTPPVFGALLPKAIQELFTLDYGRMNATLGVEIPKTNFQTQTTIPYGYADPPTEIFKDGETQFWKITHNGVDTHFIHFHLFTVQIINRVGWDGAIKPPDPYELGMKDTVRMNPLEDIIVALRPFHQTVPFPVPNSWRPMNVTMPVGTTSTIDYTNVDPTGQPANVINARINFGWEYVWHCHILGHEENDMMRAMILAVAPAVPSVTPTVTISGSGKNTVRTVTLTITPALPAQGFSEATGFTVQRAASATGPWTTVGSVAANGTAPVTFAQTVTPGTYYYQVIANNLVGYTQPFTLPAVGYPNVSADSVTAAATGAVIVQ